jgi:hypothetical protein
MGMNEPRPQSDTLSSHRRKKARAKRGLIAGYIHEISGRHEGARAVQEAASEPAAAATEAPSVSG